MPDFERVKALFLALDRKTLRSYYVADPHPIVRNLLGVTSAAGAHPADYLSITETPAVIANVLFLVYFIFAHQPFRPRYAICVTNGAQARAVKT